ncbi:hypothetical protein ACFLWV_02235 [Chloroflexota bacterium]
MAVDLSLDDYAFNVTELAHVILDKYSQTHPGVGKNQESAPFRTMKDVFIMAVHIGSKGRPRPLDGKRISPFKGGVLNHDEQMYLRSIAIGSTGDPNIISEPQKVVRIIEEFANAGIWELEKILTSSDEGPLWDLTNYFTDELTKAKS